jgi:hypothetical protein
MALSQAFAVAPLNNRNSELRFLAGGEASSLPEILLDEEFVAQVRKAYAGLDLTDPDDIRIVHAIWARLLGLPVVQDGTREEIKSALTYLVSAGEILLPCSPEELTCE